MKENVIDVLMFLFDNYLGLEDDMPTDEETLACELEEAGFPAKEISKAFDWLGELADIKNTDPSFVQAPGSSLRVYAQIEQDRLDPDCRGFLQYLESAGLLDTLTREIIIDRAMAIDNISLSLQQFKRVVGLVMLNRAQHEEMLACIEGLIYEEPASITH